MELEEKVTYACFNFYHTGNGFTTAVRHGFLGPNSAVTISLWITSIFVTAYIVFFLMGSLEALDHWKASRKLGAFVTLVIIQALPILDHCFDWSILVLALGYSGENKSMNLHGLTTAVGYGFLDPNSAVAGFFWTIFRLCGGFHSVLPRCHSNGNTGPGW